MTPIDWKPAARQQTAPESGGRQSLVTPIDWKHHGAVEISGDESGRQSLVTPIDWKLVSVAAHLSAVGDVANPW